jgi:hypothetical protein
VVIESVQEARRARRQLWLVGLTSGLGLAFLVGCIAKSIWFMGASALAYGLSYGLLDWAEPGGFERHLTRSPIRSPADWRVRELGETAGVRVEPYIWARRVLLVSLLAVLIVPDVF